MYITQIINRTLVLGGGVKNWFLFETPGSLLKLCGKVPNNGKTSLFGVDTYIQLSTPTLLVAAEREKCRFSDPHENLHLKR